MNTERRVHAVENTASPQWNGFLRLYRQVFPPWEREPDAVIARRLDAERYQISVICDRDGRVTGGSIVDIVPERDYALLCYVAVAPGWRGCGLGKRLSLQAVRRFRRGAPVRWLLVEAEDGPSRLYRRCGFGRLRLDYRVPYIDAPGTAPMELLALGKDGVPERMDGHRLAAVVEHLFVDGYRVRRDDPRLRRQLSRIPNTVKVEDAPVSTAS